MLHYRWSNIKLYNNALSNGGWNDTSQQYHVIVQNYAILIKINHIIYTLKIIKHWRKFRNFLIVLPSLDISTLNVITFCMLNQVIHYFLRYHFFIMTSFLHFLYTLNQNPSRFFYRNGHNNFYTNPENI